MRVLVCGGRNFQYESWLFSELDKIHASTTISHIIEGGQVTKKGTFPGWHGADWYAHQWALARKVYSSGVLRRR